MITNSWQFAFKFAWLAFRAARKRRGNVRYSHLSVNGVVQAAVLIATGREAWRVSLMAIECEPGRRILGHFQVENPDDHPHIP